MRADLLFLFRFHLLVYLFLLSWLMLLRPLQQRGDAEGRAIDLGAHTNRIEQIQLNVQMYGFAETAQMLFVKSIRHITFFFPFGVLLVMSFAGCQTTPRLLLTGTFISAALCIAYQVMGHVPLDIDGMLFNIIGVWAGGRALTVLESSSASV